MSSGEARAFKRQLEQEGFIVLKTKSSHWDVRSPDGQRVTIFGVSPGGGNRWRDNCRAQIRRWQRAQSERSVTA